MRQIWCHKTFVLYTVFALIVSVLVTPNVVAAEMAMTSLETLSAATEFVDP